MSKHYYITTTLPYVNAEPHLGFAVEAVRADVLARLHRFANEIVWFNSGVDEHGLKIYRTAQARGLTPQAYCDLMVKKFLDLQSALNLSYDSFIRTTDAGHQRAAQEFWRHCAKNGDIYKARYEVRYCVGCELEKTASELVNNHCPLHPDQELEELAEENYFFRWSKYQAALLKLYKNNPQFVLPAVRQKELLSFVKAGLKDFSISRLKTKMPWGVPVPDDSEQVMYVWFDALINYISCLGWPFDYAQGKPRSAKATEDKSDLFKCFWPGTQICGKDNLRQQAAMWQAMLMSAKLPNSRQIIVNGFITAGGQKMSKSSGNVVDPLQLVKTYGADAARYYLLAELQPFEDSDYTIDKFKICYQADLANGLGNLVSRLANLFVQNQLTAAFKTAVNQKLFKEVKAKLDQCLYHEALAILWGRLKNCDEQITKTKPWSIKDEPALAKCLRPITQNLVDAAVILQIFLPATAEKIINIFQAKKIIKPKALFPRL